MATRSIIPLSYDYEYERAQALDCARRIRAELNIGKSALQLAGERLDTATSIFLNICSDDRPEIHETLFGNAEREYLEARADYFAELMKATGETATDLQRRIAA